MTTAEQRAAQAKHVWAELAVLTGCTSPDGSAELEQVKLAYEQRYEARADAARARELLLRSKAFTIYLGDDRSWADDVEAFLSTPLHAVPGRQLT